VSHRQEQLSGKYFLSANRQAFLFSLSELSWRNFPVGQPTGTIILTVMYNFLWVLGRGEITDFW